MASRSSASEPKSPSSKPASHGSAWEAAVEYGIDVSLLEHNLSLPPTERLEQLQQMTELYELLRPRSRHDADDGNPADS